jgi:hypothetical protein
VRQQPKQLGVAAVNWESGNQCYPLGCRNCSGLPEDYAGNVVIPEADSQRMLFCDASMRGPAQIEIFLSLEKKKI